MNRGQGRPKSTYTKPYLESAAESGGWTVFEVASPEATKVARGIRRQGGARVRTLDLSEGKTLLVVKVTGEKR